MRGTAFELGMGDTAQQGMVDVELKQEMGALEATMLFLKKWVFDSKFSYSQSEDVFQLGMGDTVNIGLGDFTTQKWVSKEGSLLPENLPFMYYRVRMRSRQEWAKKCTWKDCLTSAGKYTYMYIVHT